MGGLAWLWLPRNKIAPQTTQSLHPNDLRRQLLQALSAVVGGGALAAMSRPAEAKDSSELPPPKRALTGRDEAGKLVFKSFDVTSKVVVQNGTRHRWRNPLPEPCLMAFVSVGGKRG